MFLIPNDILIQVLKECEGVPLASYGRPRDAFELTANIPFWTSGFGGEYEMLHKNVPAGTMIAVGNLEDLNLDDFEVMKGQLAKLDIYPFGHSGNFEGVAPADLRTKFNAASKLDNAVNGQGPISHARYLTPNGLGAKYNELVDYLSDNMTLFKNSQDGGNLVPADKGERSKIVIDLLDGLSKTVRYTRIDQAKAVAYQLKAEGFIEKEGGGDIYFNLTEARGKLVVLITNKNGTQELRPLDVAMIGRTYVTVDGQEIANRGSVDVSHIQTRGQELENQGKIVSAPPFTFLQQAAAEAVSVSSRALQVC